MHVAVFNLTVFEPYHCIHEGCHVPRNHGSRRVAGNCKVFKFEWVLEFGRSLCFFSNNKKAEWLMAQLMKLCPCSSVLMVANRFRSS